MTVNGVLSLMRSLGLHNFVTVDSALSAVG